MNPTGAPWVVTLYEDDNWQGPSIVITQDVPDFTQLQFSDGKSLNDSVSSLMIRYARPQGSSCADVPDNTLGVYLYSDSYFKGNCSYFSPTGTGSDQYNQDTLTLVVGNDKASSLRIVNTNPVITLYKNKDWQGPSVITTHDIATFTQLRFSDGKSLNDNVSSITIQWQ